MVRANLLLVLNILVIGWTVGIPYCAEVSAAKIQADRIFDSNRLLEIELEIPAKDWETLRKQSRGGGGFTAMFSNPADMSCRPDARCDYTPA